MIRFVAPALLLTITACAIAQEEPTTEPTTRPDRGPPIASLDEVRLDRRMTLLNAGERLEPTRKLPDDAASYVVELPAHKELILDLARRTGRPAPTVRVLPEESRTPDRFGVVTADHAILRKSPADEPGDRENLSDVTLGEPVWILDSDESKKSYLVHARDGYLGWVDATSIWTVDRDSHHAWLPRWSRPAMESFDVQYRPNTLGIDAIVKQRDLKKLLRKWDEAVANRPHAHSGPSREDLFRMTATSFVGTRYVWGGKTKDGMDCSGLVQTVFVGVPLPRDADQQSLVGRLVATRWDQSALLPGDLLFYLSPRRGHVNHVAIYLGDGDYIEAAGKDVHVSSMTPGKPNYDAKRAATFGWARRVIE